MRGGMPQERGRERPGEDRRRAANMRGAETMQIRTSAGTSINAAKMPRLYSLMAGRMNGATFIDYGCGRYTGHLAAFATAHGAEALFFDPYNQTEAVNAATVAASGRASFAICSNVLNVIDDDAAVTECIRAAVKMGNGTAFFTVYEGDGSGEARETMRGESWQRNAKLADYARFAPAGYRVEIKRGYMTVTA